ncbi:hypothetical protein BH11MYX3_BH11MYX3_24600 [soil metagenome]
MARFGVLIALLAQPAFASSHEDCALSGACCFPRAVQRSVKAPDLATITAISVGAGGLGRPVVKRVLAARTAALGACAHGTRTLRAHLVIAPAGTVRVEGAASCASEVLRATVFPPSTVVTAIDLTLTW